MHKIFLLLIPILLVGCSSIKTVELASTDIKTITESEPAEEALASGPILKASPVAAMSAMEMPEEIKKVEAAPDPVAMSIVVQKKTVKLIDKITDSVMSAAEATTSSTTETITYDSAGNVTDIKKEIEHGSIVENLTKLISLITGVLGLYVGFRKFYYREKEE